MRILIDLQGAQGLSYDRGIGRYSRSFAKALIHNSVEHEFYILLNGAFTKSIEAIQDEYKEILPKHHIIILHTIDSTAELNPDNEWRTKTSELIREKMIKDIAPDFIIISSLFEGGWDNSISSIGKYTKNTPVAVIFYDLIPYIYPEKFLADVQIKKWYERKITSLKQADILLAISFSASQEAVDHLHFSQEKIVNISSAADISFKMKKEDLNLKETYNITKPFIMHTSAYEERKNFEGLIQAFSLLPNKLKKEYQLVLVCKLNKTQKKLLETSIKNAGLSNSEVILTGFVSDDDLISLYSECYLFVFPSLHEGFGLPVLEAMSCGAATIGSNSSSIPEVIGREDALFDPSSSSSIASKINEVLSSPDLWSSLKNHALIQAQKFNWNDTAIKAIQFLEKAHNSNTVKDIEKNVYQSSTLLIDKIGDIESHKKPSDDDLMQAAISIDNNEKEFYKLLTYSDYGSTLKWRIEGPFDSSYSLALLNRETAIALTSLGHYVALHSTEGPGDFDANPVFLQNNPDIAQWHLNALTLSQSDADVTSRNLYPPRVCDMNSNINMLHHYAWEESGFPRKWVDDFNQCLTSMTCLSTHVHKIMIDNGVTVPMLTTGCGVDHWERVEKDKTYQIKAKSFRFLHVSSCFPRKGVDVLLKAYTQHFTKDDDVSLVIKTFSNPHNEVYTWLKNAKDKYPNYPDVVIIEDDLTEAQLKSLYMQCDALVAPSRAEGFGLPMAEAMLSGLPVITTAWGGQCDFCKDDTAWLIDYTFTAAQTHFELFDSVWAEPSEDHLASLMFEVYQLPLALRIKKSQHGRKQLLQDFKWTDVAERLVLASKTLTHHAQNNTPKIGWVTTWNTKCGIAAYSEHLINTLGHDVAILANYTEEKIAEDDKNVYRSWQAGDENSLEELAKTIKKLNLDTLVIQFNYSFFDFNYFNDFLEQQINNGKTIILMLHATIDSDTTPHKQLSMLSNIFKQCDRLLVHTPNDLNRLKSYNLIENVTLFPHGIVDWKKEKRNENNTFTLATYGFFLPHKGLLEMIEAFKILLEKGLKLKLKMVNAEYPVPQSIELIQQVKEQINIFGLSQHIDVITDFLSDDECLTYLGSSDLIVLPYQETGESSSATVRYGLATHTPVAVTPLSIFDDVGDAVFKLPGTTASDIAEGIEKIITEIQSNSEFATSTQEKSQRWVEAHHYANISQRLFQMIEALHQKI